MALVVACLVGVLSALFNIGFFTEAGVDTSLGSVAFILIGLGVVYCLAGTFWFRILFDDAMWSRWLYMAFQTIVTGAMILLSPSAGIIDVMILPLVSQSLFLFKRTVSMLVTIFLVLMIAVIDSWTGFYLPGFASRVLGMGAFALFVYLFSQMLVREQELRMQVAELNDRLREFAEQNAQLAAASERVRISREIHDSLGHHLTTVSVQLEVAQQLIPRDPDRAVDLVGKARSLTRQGLQDVREAVAQWRTSADAMKPLDQAMQEMVATARETGLNVELITVGDSSVLPSQTQRTLFRVAQEGLTNVRKHAQSADAIRVTLATDNVARLCIRDNGNGETNQDAPSGGYGLTGLRERVQMLGGNLSAAPHPEGGFELVVEVPNA